MSLTRRQNHPHPADGPQTHNDVGTVLTVHTLDEAAALLRVRRTWLERQAAARKIPFTMLGGAYHFTSHHLLAIVRLNEVAPSGPDTTASEPRQARRAPRPQTQTVAPLRARPRTGPRRAA